MLKGKYRTKMSSLTPAFTDAFPEVRHSVLKSTVDIEDQRKPPQVKSGKRQQRHAPLRPIFLNISLMVPSIAGDNRLVHRLLYCL
jgi:hypothetical protein